MVKKMKKNPYPAAAPAWVYIGAVIVLLPIFAFMTIKNINSRKESNTRLLLEKGAALIRSFEAGTRSGMMGQHWNDRRLQDLLTQTAQQPDIEYLLLTNKNGRVLVHSSLEMRGTRYLAGLSPEEKANIKTLQWRIVTSADGKRIFEVFRKFSPTGPPRRPRKNPKTPRKF